MPPSCRDPHDMVLGRDGMKNGIRKGMPMPMVSGE